ncbi:MAG: hypothetical protein WD844_00280 [Thermoleophilaceae bacterium]
MRHLAIVTAALALFVTGCGGDDEDKEPAADATTPTTESQPATTQSTPTEAEPTDTGETAGGPASEDDEEAIRETLVTWLLEGPCDLMSDKFLEEQSFVGDTREERCELFEQSHTKPQYGEDDIITSGFRVDGDTASAVISDDFSNVETTFNLVREDGTWVIDGTES